MSFFILLLPNETLPKIVPCTLKPQRALKALLPKENKERMKKRAFYRWATETQTDFLKSIFQRHTINQWQKV